MTYRLAQLAGNDMTVVFAQPQGRGDALAAAGFERRNAAHRFPAHHAGDAFRDHVLSPYRPAGGSRINAPSDMYSSGLGLGARLLAFSSAAIAQLGLQ